MKDIWEYIRKFISETFSNQIVIVLIGIIIVMGYYIRNKEQAQALKDERRRLSDSIIASRHYERVSALEKDNKDCQNKRLEEFKYFFEQANQKAMEMFKETDEKYHEINN